MKRRVVIEPVAGALVRILPGAKVERMGRTYHPGELLRVTHVDAARLVKRGEAELT